MGVIRGDDPDRLIADLYETALQPTLWTEWFSTVADKFGSSSGLCLVQTSQIGALDVLGARGFSDHASQLYADYCHQCDQWVQRFGRTQVRARTRADLCTDEEFANGEIYTDFSKQHLGGAFYVVGTVLPAGGETAVLGFHRTRSQGPFTSTHARALDRLLPHLQRALTICGKLRDAKARNAVSQAVIDALSHAVCLATLDATVVHANLAAQDILRSTDSISVGTKGVPPVNTAMRHQ